MKRHKDYTVKGTSGQENTITKGLKLVTPLLKTNDINRVCDHPIDMRYWGKECSKCLKCGGKIKH